MRVGILVAAIYGIITTGLAANAVHGPQSINPRNNGFGLNSRGLPTGTCNSDTPCANSACCGSNGLCGYSPLECGTGCTSNCNAKAQCGEYAPEGQQKCPLNVCCSQYGFCGSTSDFCGKGCSSQWGGCGDVTRPDCAGGNSVTKRQIGYYESWSSTRTCESVSPEQLNLNGFTHINFAFAFFDPSSFQITNMDANSGALYSRFTGLKSSNPGLQTWISVGGWSFTDPGATRTAFSDMASTSANRATFINGLMKFMNTYGFDGVDLDWEYPAADDRGGVAGDKENYVSLVKEIRAAFGTKYGLSMTLPTSYWYLQHFDLTGIQGSVDWFNLMAYDLHGVWDAQSVFVGPYIAPHTNITEIDLGLDLLWRAGVTPDKVVMGEGWYGRSFTLASPSCNTPNGVCQFTGGAKAGPCSGASGILDDQEIQDIIKQNSLTPVWDHTAAVKWITWDSDQWVSYDDADTFSEKRDFANKRCLGGLMVWAMDQVDQTANNGLSPAAGVSTTNGDQQTAKGLSANQLAGTTCYTTACHVGCKKGTNAVTQMNGQPGDVSTTERCAKKQYETLCCDDGTVMGKCQWRGYRGAGLSCMGGCLDGEVQVAQNTNNHGKSGDQTCNGGIQSYCCGGFTPPPDAATLEKDAEQAAKAAAIAAAENAALDLAAKAFCRVAVPALLLPLELLEDVIPIFGEIADAIEIAATPGIIEGCVKAVEKGGSDEIKVFGKEHKLEEPTKPVTDRPAEKTQPPKTKETEKPKTKSATKSESKSTSHTSSASSTSSSAASTLCAQSDTGTCTGKKCTRGVDSSVSRVAPKPKFSIRSVASALVHLAQRVGLVKRVMPGPAFQSSEAMDTFILNQWAVTSVVPQAYIGQPPSTSRGWSWATGGNPSFNMGVDNLYGCTSLVVISRAGVYMTHFFEPSFTSANFHYQVIDKLFDGTGTALMIPLTNYIPQIFTAADRPKVLIVSPSTSATSRRGSFQYKDFVNDIAREVAARLPAGTPVVKYDYVRASDMIPASWSHDQRAQWLAGHAYGHVLSQYAPTGSAANGPAYNVYVENNPIPELSDSW